VTRALQLPGSNHGRLLPSDAVSPRPTTVEMNEPARLSLPGVQHSLAACTRSQCFKSLTRVALINGHL